MLIVPMVSALRGLWVFVSKAFIKYFFKLGVYSIKYFWIMSLHLSNMGHESYFV